MMSLPLSQIFIPNLYIGRIESLIIVECQPFNIESMRIAIAQLQSRRRLLGDYNEVSG